MTVEQAILENVRGLDPDTQRRVLEFTESLRRGAQPRSACRPPRSLRGTWAGLGVDVSDDQMSQTRRELWGEFPRDMRP